MAEPLFLAPVFHEKIWGGRNLETAFDYDIPAGKIGECWAISGHEHGPNQIINGEYRGQLLPDVYVEHPELFGNPASPVFLLLTKILDANDRLSVQVHPDDAYAEEHEHELGKTECWYVIHADEGAYLTYGHTAQTKEELASLIHAGKWDQLLGKKPVKAGDFVYVPSGTIHALNKGIMVLETQQSSDTTYRLYDYDRVDQKTGQKRELHIQQSLDTTTVPYHEPNLHVTHEQVGASTVTTFITQPESPYFSVYKWDVHGTLERKHSHGPYTLMSVLDGNGTLQAAGQEYQLAKGMHLIIPAPITTWQVCGEMTIIASEPVK